MQSKKRPVMLWNPRQIALQTMPHNILIKFCCLWRIEMTQQQHMGLLHRLINYIDTKAKCCHLKTITCKGTLRQGFIKVYKLEIQSVTLVFFRPSFVACCPSNLLSRSTLPSPFPVLINILYTRKGGGGIRGLRQIYTCRKAPLQVNIFTWRHFALPSMSLLFLPGFVGNNALLNLLSSSTQPRQERI